MIDKNPLAFRRLGEHFPGRALGGVVFDRPTLEEAGIKKATAPARSFERWLGM